MEHRVRGCFLEKVRFEIWVELWKVGRTPEFLNRRGFGAAIWWEGRSGSFVLEFCYIVSPLFLSVFYFSSGWLLGGCLLTHLTEGWVGMNYVKVWRREESTCRDLRAGIQVLCVWRAEKRGEAQERLTKAAQATSPRTWLGTLQECAVCLWG